MPNLTPLPAELTTGPFTIATAHLHGVSISRTRRSDLARPFYGVRAGVAEVQTTEERCRALAVRMPPWQFFSHVTAAQLWGLPLPTRLAFDDRLHVTAVLPGHSPRLAGVVGHSTTGCPPIRLLRGLRVPPPEIAWCQLAPLLRLDELIIAGERLVGRPEALCARSAVAAAVTAHRARRGSRNLRRAVGDLRSNVESPRETVLRLVIVSAGLPEPEPNLEITLNSGATTHGDLVYRHHRVLVEYDGEHHRSDPRQFAVDVRRLNDLAAAGWCVVRVNKQMSRAEIIARVREALLSKGWRP